MDRTIGLYGFEDFLLHLFIVPFFLQSKKGKGEKEVGDWEVGEIPILRRTPSP
jgi:hypothetical protein